MSLSVPMMVAVGAVGAAVLLGGAYHYWASKSSDEVKVSLVVKPPADRIRAALEDEFLTRPTDTFELMLTLDRPTRECTLDQMRDQIAAVGKVRRVLAFETPMISVSATGQRAMQLKNLEFVSCIQLLGRAHTAHA